MYGVKSIGKCTKSELYEVGNVGTEVAGNVSDFTLFFYPSRFLPGLAASHGDLRGGPGIHAAKRQSGPVDRRLSAGNARSPGFGERGFVCRRMASEPGRRGMPVLAAGPDGLPTKKIRLETEAPVQIFCTGAFLSEFS